MDDYTWQKKLKERQTRSHRWQLLFFLCVAVALGTAAWYFGFFSRTPEYALEQAKLAWQERDGEKFKRYVNLGVLTSRAYDDLTIDLFAYDSTLTPQSKVMFEKFYILIKPQLAQGTEETIMRRLTEGSWTLPEGADILKGRQLGIDYERFLERSQLRNTTFLKVGKVDRHGSTALAEVKVREDYTQTDFTLVLSMEKAADGHWQVAYIKNYKHYLDTIAPLQNKDIADYIEATRGIVTACNEKLRDQQIKFQSLTDTAAGKLTDYQKKHLRKLLTQEVIPTLQDRQARLDQVEVPKGARYLAEQRKLSTKTTIEAWEHFIKGLEGGDQSEFATAETLHKQELAIDLRVDEIIHHTALSKNIPNLP